MLPPLRSIIASSTSGVLVEKSTKGLKKSLIFFVNSFRGDADVTKAVLVKFVLSSRIRKSGTRRLSPHILIRIFSGYAIPNENCKGISG